MQKISGLLIKSGISFFILLNLSCGDNKEDTSSSKTAIANCRKLFVTGGAFPWVNMENCNLAMAARQKLIDRDRAFDAGNDFLSSLYAGQAWAITRQCEAKGYTLCQ